MKEFPTESDREADQFFRTFTREVVSERKALFLENCERGHRYETYMCRECLRDSLKRNIGPDAQRSDFHKVNLYAQFYANAVSATLKAPGQHFHRIVNRCPYFQFQIQDADGDTPKVSYTAMRRHNYENASGQFTVSSFLSDDTNILALFKNEVSYCQSALDRSRGCDTPEGFHAFIREHFDVFGVAAPFDAALSALMASPGFHFH